MSDNQKFIQNQASYLAGSGVSIGAVEMILTSLVDLEGNTISMTDVGSKGFATIEPNSSDREEAITFTGITQNADGTATITGIKNQLGKAPYTETSGLLKSHPGGVKFVLSNTAGFHDAMSSKKNDETIEGTWTFTNPKYPRMDDVSTAPTDDEELASKKYVDDTAGGSPISINRVIPSATAGESVVAGNVLYLDETDNEWKKADASASATCDNVLLGIAQGSGTDGNPIAGGILLLGRDTNQTGFAQGDKIYISDTAGTLANSAGTIEVEVGYAISATAIDFKPKFASYTTKLQRDALVGSSGTPSTSNRYLTEDDDAITATASKLVRTKADTFIDGDFIEGSIRTLNAGETINGATLPVAVYQSTADNEIYACDGNDTAKLDFIGFAITNGTDGNPIDIQFTGIVKGFTGLTEGTRYYVQNDKTIGTSIGTYEILVGVAISETQILMRHSDITDYKVGQTTYDMTTASGTQNIAHGLGRIPKIVRLRGCHTGANFVATSQGAFDGTTNSVAWVSSSGAGAGLDGGDTTNSIRLVENGSLTNYQSGVVSVDATNIIITWTKTAAPSGIAQIQWEAEG
jgi:hypothetical protein